MKAMIWKNEKDFEPTFFDCDTIDDLLNALVVCDYAPMQINIEDDEHGNPRMGIELFDDFVLTQVRYDKHKLGMIEVI